ncbi:hypothetical protein PI126_g20941 [Phytophthora idaei]|nr:hypothetical protein PI126_g20941 [Phytophthora idaei]
MPDAEYGLFSPGLAFEQGFEFSFDTATSNFAISMEATWGFQVVHPAPQGGGELNDIYSDEQMPEVPSGKDGRVFDASAMVSKAVKQTGKRTHRDETPSEEKQVERSAAKQDVNTTRTGLRERGDLRRPLYLYGYMMNMIFSRILDKNDRPIRACEVPRNCRAAMRFKWQDFWAMAEMEENAALRANDVIQEIPCEAVLEYVQPVDTMWVYALKSDQ